MKVHPLARNNIPKQFICCPTCSLAWLESFPSHTILRSNSWSSFVANWFNLLGPSWKTKALACELLTTRKLPHKFLIYSIISLFNIIVNVQSFPLLMYLYLFLPTWSCKAFHSLFPILKYCIHLFRVQGPHIWRLLQDRISFLTLFIFKVRTLSVPW
jgi:hypothetical protein